MFLFKKHNFLFPERVGVMNVVLSLGNSLEEKKNRREITIIANISMIGKHEHNENKLYFSILFN